MPPDCPYLDGGPQRGEQREAPAGPRRGGLRARIQYAGHQRPAAAQVGGEPGAQREGGCGEVGSLPEVLEGLLDE